MSNLYIVSTPIGNLQDITLRAAKVLLKSKIIIAESTSKCGILLDFLEKQFGQRRIVNQKIVSMNEDEEEQKIGSIVRIIEQEDAALISEAGTPLISDPGFKLVREAIKKGVRIIPIPGPTSLIAALSISGLPTHKFIFLGFLPRGREKKIKELEKVKESHATIIIFESPHRLLETLDAIMAALGDVEIVVCRELTKVYEEVTRDKTSTVIKRFEERPPKGEFVILFSTKLP